MFSAGAADAAKHKIYVWDLSQEGILYETLEGGREPLVDVHVSNPLHDFNTSVKFCSGILLK